MKFETTKKAVNEGYWNIIQVGYCNLQYLLYYKEPTAYTAGVYGWNTNIFEIDNNTCICTGYRPFGNYKPDYKLQEKYNEKASKIISDIDLDYEVKKKKVNALLKKFVEEVLKND